MHQPFEKNLKAAVGPGWLIFLLAVVLLLGHMFAYVQTMKTKPDWVLDLMGPDASWAQVQILWLQFMNFWRMWCGILLLVMLWLTLWSRKLNR
jgi:hypothetical protein